MTNTRTVRPFFTAAQAKMLNSWIRNNPDDCREYDAEDIAHRFHIEPSQAEFVFQQIQTGRPAIIKGPEASFETWALHKDPVFLGRLLKEYIAESNHDGWDGFTRDDLIGIRRLLADLYIYYEYCVADDPDYFAGTNSVNPI